VKTKRPERKIAAGMVLAGAMILAVAVTTARSISRLVSDARWVDHTQQVIDTVDKLNDEITRRERDGRIFQISGNPLFFARYHQLGVAVHGTVSDLELLTHDNKTQQARLRAFENLFNQREALFRSQINQQDARAATKDLQAVDDSTLTAAFDTLIDQMRAEEQRLLQQRRTEEEASIRVTYIVLSIMGLLLAALLTATYMIARHALAARRQALVGSDYLNAELERANAALVVKSEEADHANKLKSQFLASMSHELRTPLNAISGFGELLEEQLAGPLNEKQKRFVGHIRQGARHLLQLINDVLDLSKIEAGELRLDSRPLAPAAIVDEVAAGMAALAQGKSIALRTDCAADLVVTADARRLKQILYNLLSNALKFTPDGGHVDLWVSREGANVRFEVVDDGPGISDEDQRIIFDEFRQAAAAANGAKEGTGLGLAITKKLVERQGGRIEVESRVGQGSRFRFWLPVAETGDTLGIAIPSTQAATSEGTKSSHRMGSESRRKSPLVLVVDDDEKSRELLKNVLESAGYAVSTSNSSAEAIDATRALQPDLITLDLLMPGGHGFGTLYELHAVFKDKLPPVIIVSVVDDRATGFALGATDYLLKPVSKDELLTAVRRHLPPAHAAVLVIDDDPAVLALAREVFAEPGMTVYLAASARQGSTSYSIRAWMRLCWI
jgi:signal transduction histidine kinase/DNA-binding response OmpR family regulator